jgi:Uracil DNA glycosylase superfamily
MSQSNEGTFADRVLAFYERFGGWADSEGRLVATSPWESAKRRQALTTFCRSFYGDNEDRTFCLGINPGRFASSSTGVPYTDGYALAEVCGIPNEFSKTRELTAGFFNDVVVAFGGAHEFYQRIYAGAVFPFELLFEKGYINYYDPVAWEKVQQKIETYIQEMAAFGSNGRVVILGSGENADKFSALNGRLGLFQNVSVLEHPRYIAQYKPSERDKFVEKYVRVLRGEASA